MVNGSLTVSAMISRKPITGSRTQPYRGLGVKPFPSNSEEDVIKKNIIAFLKFPMRLANKIYRYINYIMSVKHIIY
jgi:hypothetical protein